MTHIDTSPASMPETSSRFPNLFFILISVAIMGLAMGMFMPLTAIFFKTELFLDLNAKPGVLHTGWVLSLGSIATILFPFATPVIIKRFGLKNTFIGSFFIAAIAMILHIVGYYLILWYALRFVFNVCFAVILIASETYVTVMAPPKRRTKIISYYGVALALGTAIGYSTTTIWYQLYKPLPFILSTVLFILAAFLLMFFLKEIPFESHKEKANWSFLRYMPIPLAAAFIYGFMETSFTAFLPAYVIDFQNLMAKSYLAQTLGLTTYKGLNSIILPSFVIGGIILQIPIGRICTASNKKTVMLILALFTFAIMILLYFFKGLGLMVALGFLAGGMVMSFYVVGLSMIGDYCKPQQLASANSMFVLIYGISCIAGSWINGIGIESLGPNFMLFSGIVVLFLFIVLDSITIIQKKR